MSRVANLKDDLAYALAATDVRILAPIPGKQAVGVEVPNARRRIVHLGDIFQEPPAGLVAAHGVARQGRRRPGDRRRPGQDAAPARRRHDRRRQVGLRQRDALLDPAAGRPARGQARARRPQAGGAQPLRLDPAPAHAGDHQPADGGERAAEPRQGDGGSLRRDVTRAHPQPAGAQPRPGGAGRAAAAVHPVRDRRARRPDDGRAGRRRGLDHPPGPEGPGRRHAPGARHPVAAGRR